MMRMEFGTLHRNGLARENADIQRGLFCRGRNEEPLAVICHIGVVLSMAWNAGTDFFRRPCNLPLNVRSA